MIGGFSALISLPPSVVVRQLVAFSSRYAVLVRRSSTVGTPPSSPSSELVSYPDQTSQWRKLSGDVIHPQLWRNRVMRGTIGVNDNGDEGMFQTSAFKTASLSTSCGWVCWKTSLNFFNILKYICNKTHFPQCKTSSLVFYLFLYKKYIIYLTLRRWLAQSAVIENSTDTAHR